MAVMPTTTSQSDNVPFLPKLIGIVGYALTSKTNSEGPALIVPKLGVAIYPVWYTAGFPGSEYRQVTRFSIQTILSGTTCTWVGASRDGQLNSTNYIYFWFAVG